MDTGKSALYLVASLTGLRLDIISARSAVRVEKDLPLEKTFLTSLCFSSPLDTAP